MEKRILSDFIKCLGVTLGILCSFHIQAKSGVNSSHKAAGYPMEDKMNFLIDDFSNTRGTSVFGTQWRMFSDQVMGGVSTGFSRYESLKGRQCLRLQGSVSLENNGGFIQVALSLVKKNNYFDAGKFKGVRLWVLGNGEIYYVHLLSSQTRRPWQYYGAPFKATGNWEKIDIPFENFQPENLSEQVDTARLSRIAIVAIKKKFQADIAVAGLEFYQ
jgi:hypothetical protein